MANKYIDQAKEQFYNNPIATSAALGALGFGTVYAGRKFLWPAINKQLIKSQAKSKNSVSNAISAGADHARDARGSGVAKKNSNTKKASYLQGQSDALHYNAPRRRDPVYQEGFYRTKSAKFGVGGLEVDPLDFVAPAVGGALWMSTYGKVAPQYRIPAVIGATYGTKKIMDHVQNKKPVNKSLLSDTEFKSIRSKDPLWVKALQPDYVRRPNLEAELIRMGKPAFTSKYMNSSYTNNFSTEAKTHYQRNGYNPITPDYINK